MEVVPWQSLPYPAANSIRTQAAPKRRPVIITDRGRPAHVLLSIDEYRKLSGARENILDQLGMPEAAAIEFDPPRLGNKLFRPADLS